MIGLELFQNLRADVRWDGRHHPIKQLVQPEEPDVKEIARVLAQAPDFVDAAHTLIHSYTSYGREEGDFWRTPAESIRERVIDCDDSAILLASILRAGGIPADRVFVGVGLWEVDGQSDGHAWVVIQDEFGEDRILESTASPEQPLRGKYHFEAIFNDRYAFATQVGLKEFDLKTEGSEVLMASGR